MPRAVQRVAGHGAIDLLVEGQTCFLSGGESWDILIHYFEIWDNGSNTTQFICAVSS